MILATILASHAIHSKNFEHDEQLKERRQRDQEFPKGLSIWYIALYYLHSRS